MHELIRLGDLTVWLAHMTLIQFSSGDTVLMNKILIIPNYVTNYHCVLILALTANVFKQCATLCAPALAVAIWFAPSKFYMRRRDWQFWHSRKIRNQHTNTVCFWKTDRKSRIALIPMQMDCTGKESTMQTKKKCTRLHRGRFQIHGQRTP